jgi:hypothetical protein
VLNASEYLHDEDSTYRDPEPENLLIGYGDLTTYK